MFAVLQEYAADYRKKVTERIAEWTVDGRPAELWEPVRWALTAGGKMLRPVLLLISCEAVGGSADDALDAAAAVEMMHTFSLVHDDIMDNDDLRRGRLTVHKKWDVSTAILAGDAILVKAFEAFSRLPADRLPRALAVFSRAVIEVCEGQALDMAFEQRSDVRLEEYFSMIDRKTGRLFAASCTLGALLGGGSQAQIDALTAFGERIGRAFQIQDDLLDLTADETVLGKDIGSDLQEDKKTFLVLYAREHGSREQLESLRRIQQKKELSDADIRAAIDLLTEIGAVDAARRHIESALDEARRSLNLLTVGRPRTALEQLVEYIRKREY